MPHLWNRYLSMFFALLVTASGFAQTFHGTISGVVVDSQGAVISDAGVQLTNPATGLTLNGRSNKDGEFIFPELTVGVYRLTVSTGGFQTKKIDDINVEVSKVQNIKSGDECWSGEHVCRCDRQRNSDRRYLERSGCRDRFEVGARDADERAKFYADDSLCAGRQCTYELCQRVAYCQHQFSGRWRR